MTEGYWQPSVTDPLLTMIHSKDTALLLMLDTFYVFNFAPGIYHLWHWFPSCGTGTLWDICWAIQGYEKTSKVTHKIHYLWNKKC